MKNKTFTRCRGCGNMYEVGTDHKCLEWKEQ